jgi:hypothetical protein
MPGTRVGRLQLQRRGGVRLALARGRAHHDDDGGALAAHLQHEHAAPQRRHQRRPLPDWIHSLLPGAGRAASERADASSPYRIQSSCGVGSVRYMCLYWTGSRYPLHSSGSTRAGYVGRGSAAAVSLESAAPATLMGVSIARPRAPMISGREGRPGRGGGRALARVRQADDEGLHWSGSWLNSPGLCVCHRGCSEHRHQSDGVRSGRPL